MLGWMAFACHRQVSSPRGTAGTAFSLTKPRDGVNDLTRRLAPDSMQFGHALKRILQRVYDADPRHGPIYMMKVYIADIFYCVGLAPEYVPSIGVCLPLGPDSKTMVAFPLVLLMGWVESPPQFYAVTETVADQC